MDPRDWSTPGTDAIVRRVTGAARPGSIILMHDGGGPRDQTVAAIPAIVAALRARGYRFDTVPALIGQVQSGNLKVLAVTGKERVSALPDVPTAIESGVLPGYDVTSWYGVFGPSGMPPAVVTRLNKALMEIIAEKGIAASLAKAGVVVQGSTPEAFGKFLADEYTRWDRVREAAGIERK